MDKLRPINYDGCFITKKSMGKISTSAIDKFITTYPKYATAMEKCHEWHQHRVQWPVLEKYFKTHKEQVPIVCFLEACREKQLSSWC